MSKIVILILTPVWIFTLLLTGGSTAVESTENSLLSVVQPPPPLISPTPPQPAPIPSKPNFKCCGKNEVPSLIDDICGIKTCSQAINPPKVRCYAIALRNNCACKSKYYRDRAMRCVSLKECKRQQKKPPKMPQNTDKCNGKHMILVGGLSPKDYPFCPGCSSKYSSPFATFIKQHRNSNQTILRACICKPHYYFNKCGKCVKKKDCHKKCCELKCPGPNEYKHNGKCKCKWGYKRDKCGQCISKYQRKYEQQQNCLCLNTCTGANTILRTFDQYSERTCFNRFNCTQPGRGKPQKQVGCDCQKGFYSLDGSCVRSYKCGKCPSPSTSMNPVPASGD